MNLLMFVKLLITLHAKHHENAKTLEIPLKEQIAQMFGYPNQRVVMGKKRYSLNKSTVTRLF